MPRLGACVCLLSASVLGLRRPADPLGDQQGRQAKQHECPTTPVAGKEVCFFMAGETFREGGWMSRKRGNSPHSFEEQELASRSQIVELLEVFEEFCAKPVLFLRTKPISGDDVQAERALRRLQHWYGGPKRLPRQHIEIDPANSTRAADLWHFYKTYREHSCDGGVMWLRPDLVFTRNMSTALRTAGVEADHVYDPRSPDYPWPRHSFEKGGVRPVDLDKLLFLFPVWAQFDRRTMPVLGKNISHWRIPDVWMWIPGRLWNSKTLRMGGIRGMYVSHDAMFGFHNIGIPEAKVPEWVQQNVAFLGINSQHDSNSQHDWNPFYRMAGRPEKAFSPVNAPSMETERHIKSALSSKQMLFFDPEG